MQHRAWSILGPRTRNWAVDVASVKRLVWSHPLVQERYRMDTRRRPTLVGLLLLFVMVDGWALIVKSLITSFH